MAHENALHCGNGSLKHGAKWFKNKTYQSCIYLIKYIANVCHFNLVFHFLNLDFKIRTILNTFLQRHSLTII